MGLEGAFERLTLRFVEVYEAVNSLLVTIGDRHDDGGLLVDSLDDAAADLLGLLQEARVAAAEAARDLRPSSDLDAGRRALALCQRRFRAVERNYSAKLGSFDRLTELLRVGGRGGEWLAWAGATKEAIERCRVPLEDAGAALVVCWEELAEMLVWVAKSGDGGLGGDL
jgi:hypothetical protein